MKLGCIICAKKIKEMNIKQKTILRKLVEINGQRFSELLRHFSYEDKFPYHLKYLLNKKLISKREGKYYLTKKGMKETSKFDTKTLQDIEAPISAIIFLCKHEDKYWVFKHFAEDLNEKRHLYTLASAKPLWGETLEISCKKEFLRKNGILADFKYRNTFHLINKTTDGDVLFDNVFLIFETELTKAQVKQSKKGFWLTKEEIKEIPNISITVKKFILEDNRNPYIEDIVILNYGIEERDL